MTENSVFFGARRGVGPPDADPQTGSGPRGCQRRQIEPDSGWKRRPHEECKSNAISHSATCTSRSSATRSIDTYLINIRALVMACRTQ